VTAGSTATAEPGVELSAEARAARVGEVTLPTRRDEAWRYAPHGELAKLTFGPGASTPVDVPAEVEAQIPAIDGPRVVVVNGLVDHGRSRLDDLPTGLQISSLAEVIADRPSDVAPHFEAALTEPADAFTALNAAFGGDGAVVDIADGAEVGTVHLVDITIPDSATNGSATGIVVTVGNGATATLIQTRIGGGDAFGGSTTRTTIDVGQDASLEHLVLQDAPADQISIDHIEVNQRANSTFLARSFNLGASYGRVAYRVHLTGEAATTELAGLYFGFGDQTLDQQVTVIHGAENCVSRQAFRGVLDDASTGVFNGSIDVSPGADGTDAEQSNDNLLLSDRAEINTQPRLEILADDVACKHGATVGQLDETALYYMRSRGIPAVEARRLLINSFADQTVALVELDAVRAWITARLGHDLDQVGVHAVSDEQAEHDHA